MIEIPLTKGKVALIDDEDWTLVSGNRWHAKVRRYTSYAVRVVRSDKKRTFMQMHRLIMGAAPGQEVDHIDGDGLNNTRANLRLCTHSQNQCNTVKRTGVSRYRGVGWHRVNRLWFAQIGSKANHVWLGSFKSETDAAKAYDAAAIGLYGAFARLNFPEDRELTHG